MLNDKKLRLELLNVRHQVNIAVYETKREFFIDEINSLEKQLEAGKNI
jgi:hypothetical protein